MKILIVTEVFYPENFLINDLATELVKRGYDIEVMTRQPSYPEGKVYDGYKNENYSVEEWCGIKIHRFKTIEGYKTSKIKKIVNYFHYVSVGKKVIEKIIDGVDVIFVHQTGPLTLALPAVYARNKYHIPTIIWSFDIWPDTVFMYGFPKIPPLTTYLDYIIRKVYRNMDKIMVSSIKFISSIKPYCGKEDIVYAPNWMVEQESIKSTLILSKNKVNFTFTGNISAAQNLENVLKGFALANLTNARLNIVGNGSLLEKLKRLVSELNVDNIIFHGRYPASEIDDILCQSDFLVLPLLSVEGIDKTEPFKLQSYLKSGKPIFGVINGAGREIIEENELGICANPDEVSDISAGFKKMMSLSKECMQNCKNSAEALLQDRFCRSRIISRIENVICEVKQESSKTSTS